jgi:hypothetical protein
MAISEQSSSIIGRVAEAVYDPGKMFAFSRDDRDALMLLRTIMDFDPTTGRTDVKHPWLPVVDHILELLR